jgi:predicted dienelactone hydrolase
VKRRSLELAGGDVALVARRPSSTRPADHDKLLQALSQLGAQSLHPELASIPILFVGHSQGGCTAYGFSRAHGARVAGSSP